MRSCKQPLSSSFGLTAVLRGASCLIRSSLSRRNTQSIFLYAFCFKSPSIVIFSPFFFLFENNVVFFGLVLFIFLNNLLKNVSNEIENKHPGAQDNHDGHLWALLYPLTHLQEKAITCSRQGIVLGDFPSPTKLDVPWTRGDKCPTGFL